MHPIHTLSLNHNCEWVMVGADTHWLIITQQYAQFYSLTDNFTPLQKYLTLKDHFIPVLKMSYIFWQFHILAVNMIFGQHTSDNFVNTEM